ncbi:MAG: hypothetical protein SGJ19_20240 [Planctomycetia bacterium]|nr:hypothetical protein [Planctomycetia bacterium]
MPKPSEAQNQDGPESEDASAGLHADRLTWAVLLGRWIDFARGAVALPNDAEGTRMRESIPDIIMLQAVWFALQHLQELKADERSLGIARAEVLIEKHEGALRKRWGALPDKVSELVADAREQLSAAHGTA